jgi:hypothetical protein
LLLQLREIGAALPGGGRGHEKAQDGSSDERSIWLDSSLDLERGLDVIELKVLPDLPPSGAAPTRTG